MSAQHPVPAQPRTRQPLTRIETIHALLLALVLLTAPLVVVIGLGVLVGPVQ